MQIFDGNEYDLKQKFSLSPVAVVCVGLLRNKNVYLTEPFLEICSKGAPLEGFLKERYLPESIENSKELLALHAKHDPDAHYEIVVLDEGTRKILALQMEVAAEAGWQKKEEALPVKSGDMALLDVRIQGLSSFFSQEEIHKIKVTLATAVNAREKREAIRKMALSNVSEQEKGILFLHTLSDAEQEVRTEAAKALCQIGFSKEIAGSIQNLAEGDKGQRLHSIHSLGKLFSQANDLEKAAILQIFMATLRDIEYKDFRLPLWKEIVLVCPYIPDRATQMLDQIMACSIDMMVSHLSEVIECFHNLFSSLAIKNQERIVAFLTKEIDKTQERRLKAFLLVLLSQNAPNLLSEEMISKMVFEISLGDELDPVYSSLNASIVNLGEKAIPFLLDRFSVTIRTTERMQIAKLFASILAQKNVQSVHKNKILESYIHIFPTAPDLLRILLLDTELLQNQDVLPSLKVEFAKEILVDIHKDRLDQLSHSIKAALCRMKKTAILALIPVIRNPLHSAQSIKASEILGDVVLHLSEKDKEDIVELKNFCYQEIQNAQINQGELFCVLGKIAACSASDSVLCEEICEYLLSHLCKTTYPYLLLEGLACAASSAYSSHETKHDVCQLFMSLMDRRLPENLIQEKKQGETKIYECSGKTSAYTELLPVLLRGFQHLAIAPGNLPTLRKTIILYLLQKWEDIVSYKIIWGPKNTTDIAETLYTICLNSTTEEEHRIAIVKALYEKISIFSITEMLSHLFLECSGKKWESLAEQTAQSLLSFCQSEDYTNQEDREILLRCIGKMAKAKKLAKTKKKSEEIREKLLYSLFDGLRDQIFGVRDILEDLLCSSNVSPEYKNTIQKRLPS